MIPMRDVLIDIMEGRLDPLVLVRTNVDIKARRLLIVSVLNFFEELAIAVLRGSADEDRLKLFFSAIASQSFAKLEDWIRNERKIDNEDGYYTQFEKVVKRWNLNRR